MKTRMSCRSGFTIVELLVVVAIIVVLAALSFVFMKRGRDAAYEVRCLGNIRQICADHIEPKRQGLTRLCVPPLAHVADLAELHLAKGELGFVNEQPRVGLAACNGTRDL